VSFSLKRLFHMKRFCSDCRYGSDERGLCVSPAVRIAHDDPEERTWEYVMKRSELNTNNLCPHYRAEISEGGYDY
jgi:hypothetical protein